MPARMNFPFRNAHLSLPRSAVLGLGLLWVLLPLIGPLPGGLAADELPAERQALLAHLDYTEHLVLSAAEGLSAAQADWRASEDRWSVLDCVEHLVKAEGFLRQRAEALLATDATDPLPSPAAGDVKILATVANRSQTIQAPEGLRPERTYDSLEAALEAFQQERATTRELVRRAAGDLRRHVGETAVGPADAHQGILFISGHTERHSLQMLEVLAEPRFPGGEG